jgi:hypothetical protein
MALPPVNVKDPSAARGLDDLEPDNTTELATG